MTLRKLLIGSACTAAFFAIGAAPAMATSNECYYSGGSYSGCGDSPTSDASETNDETNRATTTATINTVGNRIASVFGSRTTKISALDTTETGVSTGDGPIKYALWAAMGGTHLSSTVTGASFEGSVVNQTVGFDMMLSDRLVAGVSLFHEGTSLQTHFNGGGVDANGWSVVPYVGFDFGQGTTIDGLVGLTRMETDTERAGATATGHFESIRTMAAANIHHGIPVGNWLFRGDAGLSFAYSESDSYAEKGAAAQQQQGSTSHLVQGRLGGRVSYLLGRVEPYVAAAYAYDFVHDYVGDDGAGGGVRGSDDADELQTYLGLDWAPTATESVGVEINRTFFRDRTESMGVLMNARLRF